MCARPKEFVCFAPSSEVLGLTEPAHGNGPFNGQWFQEPGGDNRSARVNRAPISGASLKGTIGTMGNRAYLSIYITPPLMG